MDPPRRVRHVSQPILRLEVVGPDGERQDELRVFCRLRNESMAVGYCCACPRCDAITTGEVPSVDCTVSLPPEADEPDPLGERTSVGTLLSAGAKVLSADCTLRDAVALLDRSTRSIAVVDGAHVLVGIVHEMTVVHCRIRNGPVTVTLPVADAMTSPVAIGEELSVRAALRVLAATHSRDAVVVTAAGAPLGIFRDVDAMQWIARARDSSSPLPLDDDDDD
jgi:CBS domain-containing protein